MYLNIYAVRVMTLLYFLLCTSLFFTPISGVEGGIPHFDKVGHVLSFFGIAASLFYSFKPKWPTIIAIGVGYGLAIELIQSTLPYRSGSVLDLVADLVGILLFLALPQSIKSIIKVKS